MSSMRNAVSRRPHKERAQPAARAKKWGMLEKHKDYSLRAQDYNAKKEKLKHLERKVREKHPDEFAYGMLGRREGKHGAGGDEGARLGHDAVKLLKTQDAGYLRVAMARNRREVERVREAVGAVVGEGRKVRYEDEDEADVERKGRRRGSGGEVLIHADVDEAEAEVQDLDAEMDEDEGSKPVRPKSAKSLLAEKDAAARLRAQRKRRRRLQDARATKLDMLRRRQREIMAAADQLELQRAKMAKTVGGVNKNGVKFKIRERKK